MDNEKKTCKSCGNELDEEDAFCPACGDEL